MRGKIWSSWRDQGGDIATVVSGFQSLTVVANFFIFDVCRGTG